MVGVNVRERGLTPSQAASALHVRPSRMALGGDPGAESTEPPADFSWASSHLGEGQGARAALGAPGDSYRSGGGRFEGVAVHFCSSSRFLGLVFRAGERWAGNAVACSLTRPCRAAGAPMPRVKRRPARAGGRRRKASAAARAYYCDSRARLCRLCDAGSGGDG